MSIERRDIERRLQRSYAEGRYRRLAGDLKGRERIAIYTLPRPLPGGSALRIGPNEYRVEKDSHLVFIDLMHMANYTHPVVYELHDIETGAVTTIEEKFPLADRELEDSLIPLVSPDEQGSSHAL